MAIKSSGFLGMLVLGLAMLSSVVL